MGLVVTLEAPSALSVGLCLTHMATGKRVWLERLGVAVDWPISGKPVELYLDNAAEFKSEALRRGCEQHGVRRRHPRRMPAHRSGAGPSRSAVKVRPFPTRSARSEVTGAGEL